MPSEKATTTVELGPRSLALLRRTVALLEVLANTQMPDPGRDSEDDGDTNSLTLSDD